MRAAVLCSAILVVALAAPPAAAGPRVIHLEPTSDEPAPAPPASYEHYRGYTFDLTENADRNDVGALIFADADACRTLCAGAAADLTQEAGVLKEFHVRAVGMTINSQKAAGHTAGETVTICQNDHRSVAICQSAVIQAAKQIAEFRQVTDIMP